jgi:hypothetical protein
MEQTNKVQDLAPARVTIPDLREPSLVGLAYILRRSHLWPQGFEWHYKHSGSCAMALVWETWHRNVDEAFPRLAECNEQYIFYNDVVDGVAVPLDSITPEIVATRIDEYLAAHGEPTRRGFMDYLRKYWPRRAMAASITLGGAVAGFTWLLDSSVNADPVVDEINRAIAIQSMRVPVPPPVMVQISPGVWVSSWECVTVDSQGRVMPCSSGGNGDSGGTSGQ